MNWIAHLKNVKNLKIFFFLWELVEWGTYMQADPLQAIHGQFIEIRKRMNHPKTKVRKKKENHWILHDAVSIWREILCEKLLLGFYVIHLVLKILYQSELARFGSQTYPPLYSFKTLYATIGGSSIHVVYMQHCLQFPASLNK